MFGGDTLVTISVKTGVNLGCGAQILSKTDDVVAKITHLGPPVKVKSVRLREDVEL